MPVAFLNLILRNFMLDKEKRETLFKILIAVIVTPIILITSLLTAWGWYTTPMHLVTPEEIEEAIKNHKPIPRSHWLVEQEDGSIKKVFFKNEDIAKKHYEFQHIISSSLIDFVTGGEGGGALASGDFTWSASSNLPAYRPCHNLYSNFVGIAGNCTWYAADRLYQLGVNVSGHMMGNGADWARNAVRYGLAKQTFSPKAGDIVSWAGDSTPIAIGQYGHVSVVEEVRPDGTVICSGMWGSEAGTGNHGSIHMETYPPSVAKRGQYVRFNGMKDFSPQKNKSKKP